MTKQEVEFYERLSKSYDDSIAAGIVFTEVKLPENYLKATNIQPDHILHEVSDGNFVLPVGHKPFLRVGNGGSSCATCKYIIMADGNPICTNKYYNKWEGTNKLPEDVYNYCSDWWEPK